MIHNTQDLQIIIREPVYEALKKLFASFPDVTPMRLL